MHIISLFLLLKFPLVYIFNSTEEPKTSMVCVLITNLFKKIENKYSLTKSQICCLINFFIFSDKIIFFFYFSISVLFLQHYIVFFRSPIGLIYNQCSEIFYLWLKINCIFNIYIRI